MKNSNLETMHKINGFMAATLTPFTTDFKIDYDKINYLANLLINNNIGTFINGTTGEFCSLTIEERKMIAEKWNEIYFSTDRYKFNGKFIIHVGSQCLEESKELARHANTLLCCDGIAALPPFYFKPASIEILIEFLKKIASESPRLPFYYYHIPSLTGVSFSMYDLVEKIADEIPNFKGIKFSHSDLPDLCSVSRFRNKKLNILYGTDQQILEGLIAGADGAVGSTYQLPFMIPIYNNIFNSFTNGDIKTAQENQYRSIILCKLLTKRGRNYIATHRSIFKLSTKIDLGPPRLPCKPLSLEEEVLLRNELIEFQFI